MAGRALVPLVMPEKVAPLIATLFSSIPSKGEFEDDSKSFKFRKHADSAILKQP